MTRCFVVMGYGKKTDYFIKSNVKSRTFIKSNVKSRTIDRTIDLDNIYNKLIKPTLDNIDGNFHFVRGDELQYSGIIDTSMYDLLMTADLVIADITTLNANAMYELGIRHALKPYSTIIMKEEDDQNPPFDVSHVRIFNYCIDDLKNENQLSLLKEKLLQYVKETLKKISNNPQPDSPFFDNISFDYKVPQISTSKIDEIWSSAINNNSVISSEIEKANEFEKFDKINEAVNVYEKLIKNYGDDDFFIQRLAYLKSRINLDLKNAEKIIEKLNPLTSLDTETTGIYGAIEKRLYLNNKKNFYIRNAIKSYQRGYILKNDYYNGENYVNCLCIEFLDSILDENEVIYYEELIKKVNSNVLNLAKFEFNNDNNDYWAASTLSNCYLLLNDINKSEYYKDIFEEKNKNQEQLKSFEETQKLRNDFLGKIKEK